MIKVLYDDGRYAPIMICDVCGERIEDAKNGAAVSNSDPEVLSDGDAVEVKHTHKGDCHDEADQHLREQGIHPGWNSLTTHLMQVLHNTGLSPKDLEDILRGRDYFDLDRL